MKRFLFIISIIATALLSCNIFSSPAIGEIGNVENVASDDALMNSAIQRAQETLPLFIVAFQSPKPTQTYFSIKAKFPYGDAGAAEHIWLGDISFTEEKFEGVLENEPIYIHNLKIGERITVKITDVTDWMIIDGEQLVGGFTIHVLRNQMTEKERYQFDNEFGVAIPDTPTLP